MQRTLVMIAGLLLASTPLAAQDTAITIQKRNSDTECTVRVNGRQLSPAEAKPICDRNTERVALMRIRTDSMRSMVTGLGDRIRELRIDSLATLTRRHAEVLEKEMASLDNQRAFFDILSTRPMAARPIIGVSVDPSPRATDRIGAYVVAVTPNGPADKAGIRSGDIIAKVAGTEIGTRNQDAPSGGQSLPSIKLIEVVGALEAGKPVRIEYRRDDKARTATVTPEEERSRKTIVSTERYPTTIIRPGVPAAPMAPDAPAWVVDEPRGSYGFVFGMGGALAKLELAPMNPKLGNYFGATSGVLVVNVPEKDNLGLQPGDVVTAVDGRRVETPNEFLRVLRTYDRDRTFTLQVTRQKRSETLSATLP